MLQKQHRRGTLYRDASCRAQTITIQSRYAIVEGIVIGLALAGQFWSFISFIHLLMPT